MDTNRINIINRDLSEGGSGQAETLKGFTVVKAEKGPIRPVLIPAGNPAMVYEILGYTSKDFPQIQEVLDFNKQHDVYVSAPYSQATATVPVALVSAAGIFPAMDQVSLAGASFEDINEGEEIEGINTFPDDPTVLVPVGKEASLFSSSSLALAKDVEALTYEGDALYINFGFNIRKALEEEEAEGIDVFTDDAFTAFDSRVIRRDTDLPEIVFDIPGRELMIISLDAADGVIVKDSNGGKICDVAWVGEADNNVIKITKLAVQASGTTHEYFSPEGLAQWGVESFRKSVGVFWKSSLDKGAVKAAIYPKYISERSLSLTFPRQVLGNRISFTASEKITPTTFSSRKITGSLKDDEMDGFGAPLSFGERLEDQNLVNVCIIEPFDQEDVYSSTRSVTAPELSSMEFKLSRGSRKVEDNDIERAWEEQASDPDYSHVEIFFRPDVIERDDPTAFFGLASTHKLARFVASISITPTQAKERVRQLAKGPNYFILTNDFQRRSSFTREDYWSPLTGVSSSMYLACVDQKMGGVAPMYLNSNGLGGQLGVSVKKPRYKFNKDQLTNLDNANYNPIIRDQSYGVMIVGQKTAQGGELSDWSYIGHASSFLKLLREVHDEVMVPQLGKPNNPFYRDLRGEQVNMILRPRIEGASRIWADAVGDTSLTVNTVEVRKDRKFAIVINVKVDIFSEGVDLVLINHAQGTEIA